MPNCRFCKAGSDYQKIEGNCVYGGGPGHKFWRCLKCDMVYLFPTMSEEEETLFYRKEFEKYMHNRAGEDTSKGWVGPEAHIEKNQPEVRRRIQFLKERLGEKKKILEIGCSSGFMLMALAKMGHTAIGVEPSGGFVDFIRSKGFAVYGDKKEVMKGHRDFDLILHYYVLEHIREPGRFIKDYMNLLKVGGRMVFEIPSVGDPLITLYNIPAFQEFYWSIVHHWYFSKTSIANLLDKLGYKYEIYPEQRYDLSNHIVWMLEGKPGGKGRYSQVFSEDLDNKYKEDLKRNWCCDTIIVEVFK